MSSLHSIKKNIEKSSLKFAPDMYNNTLGSVIISACIFNNPDKDDICSIKKTWNKIKKNPELVPCWIDDKEFISKWLKIFNIKMPENFSIAMVQSKYNILFMPYLNDTLMPLREDGIFPLTSKCGKIYPVDIKGGINNGLSENTANV